MGRLRVKEILNKTVNYFKEQDIDQPRLDAEVLLAYVLGMERVNLYVEFNRPLTTAEVDQYRELVIKRRKGIPVAYLVGQKEFMSLAFEVTSDVLIPRPETEHLVETALEVVEEWDRGEITAVDVGTGSGAIIISLVKLAELAIKGVGIDISKKALELAKQNARRHQVAEQIQFIEGDLLSPVEEEVDLIVSNPPYIPSQQLDSLAEEVKNQPELALDGGYDGLDYYRRLIEQSKPFLKAEGKLILEVGQQQAKAVSELLTQAGFSEINIKADYADIERVVSAQPE